MNKEDANKKHSRTWTRLNDDSKSKIYRKKFVESFGGEFIQLSRWEWKWSEPKPEPEPTPEPEPKSKRTIVMVRPDGEEDEITNLSKYCRDHGLDDAAVYRVLKGDRNHHKGYKARKGD